MSGDVNLAFGVERVMSFCEPALWLRVEVEVRPNIAQVRNAPGAIRTFDKHT